MQFLFHYWSYGAVYRQAGPHFVCISCCTSECVRFITHSCSSRFKNIIICRLPCSRSKHLSLSLSLCPWPCLSPNHSQIMTQRENKKRLLLSLGFTPSFCPVMPPPLNPPPIASNTHKHTHAHACTHLVAHVASSPIDREARPFF